MAGMVWDEADVNLVIIVVEQRLWPARQIPLGYTYMEILKQGLSRHEVVQS